MSEKEATKQLNIEINGQPYAAKPGEMIIQIADRHGIYIPRFCYHKKLSIAANCRMCLVEVEGARKPSPACATPIMDGMKVFTKSPTTLSYQKKVMEFLLINHPLDCPICDQGGECELQDVAMGYGSDVSKYNETKRVFDDPTLGPLVATDMTRCIQCTRCVRFGEEISGDKELGAMGRGDHTQIGTYVAKTVNSELSGNIIDLCPVGALTSKPFRFHARAWELQQYATISGADCVGANIYAHTRRNQLMRVVPKENESINETWIADKDRFAYTGVYAEDRVTQPMIKKAGAWVDVSWEEALDFVKVAIEQTKAQDGVNAISSLASDSLTTESLYLIQKLMRQVGSNNIDTRLMQAAHALTLHTGIGFDCELAEIENADIALLIGSYLRKEVPLINHRVHKAVKNGARVLALNSQEYDFNYAVQTTQVEANEMVYALANLVKAVAQKSSQPISSEIVNKTIETLEILPEIEALATALVSSENPVMILGFDAILNEDFAEIYALFTELKTLLSAKGGVLSFGANAKGALLAGAASEYLPGANENLQQGMNTQAILSNKTKLLLTFSLEPEFDSVLGQEALQKLQEIDIVAAFTSYATAEMFEYADIILPITTHFEEDGSFINIAGQTQHFKAVIQPYEDSKPLWKVLRVLANLLSLDGFDYQTVDEVYQEFTTHEQAELKVDVDGLFKKGLTALTEGYHVTPSISMYCTNALLRRAKPLQATKDTYYAQSLRVSAKYAAAHEINASGRVIVKLDGEEYEIDLIVDGTLAKDTIIVPFQLMPTCGKAWGNVTITPIKQTVVNA
ncbi:NADH-quinone oxidoreductase subunit NuoG [Cysteiniphilum sp. QT6929]|uniref:NADH-quinone oxidoreductase subunit NuoG n=1 Tax=Cysteiniphilum sp. QT6929 TaxID=2975055 RepID=UPI0024B36A3E|nr:NADH-quinone oxidoreductase subunit NuoG [Cysteiniphilum sp. QT6929]WHN65150.1 NADH-quinone oxidoreductase subunit NuoG [Cysteiniphilum sp. QT6929]